mgnify:CR=1 FL=1
MIELYLQAALEFLKEIWFQLDSILGLEETEAFKLIKSYLLELRDTPTYMGIAFALLTLILLGLYKARSIAREREPKVEKLIEEMDEEEKQRSQSGQTDIHIARPVPSSPHNSFGSATSHSQHRSVNAAAQDEEHPGTTEPRAEPAGSASGEVLEQMFAQFQSTMTCQMAELRGAVHDLESSTSRLEIRVSEMEAQWYHQAVSYTHLTLPTKRIV